MILNSSHIYALGADPTIENSNGHKCVEYAREASIKELLDDYEQKVIVMNA